MFLYRCIRLRLNIYVYSHHNLPHIVLEAQKEKTALLKQHHIAIYRCHDLWDGIPDIGVRDTWAKIMNIPFKPCKPQDYIRILKVILLKYILLCITL